MSRLQRAASVVREDPVLAFRMLKQRLLPPPQPPRTAVRRKVHGDWSDFDPASDLGVADKMTGRYEIHIVSALGAGLVGTSGQVQSFEPFPRYLERLKSLAAANPDHRITVDQCAVGDAPGTASISVANTQTIGWNTMAPGFMEAVSIRETVAAPVITLSDSIARNNLSRIHLIKTDTEGFEYPVLRGLKGLFVRSTERAGTPALTSLTQTGDVQFRPA